MTPTSTSTYSSRSVCCRIADGYATSEEPREKVFFSLNNYNFYINDLQITSITGVDKVKSFTSCGRSEPWRGEPGNNMNRI